MAGTGNSMAFTLLTINYQSYVLNAKRHRTITYKIIPKSRRVKADAEPGRSYDAT